MMREEKKSYILYISYKEKKTLCLQKGFVSLSLPHTEGVSTCVALLGSETVN